MQSLGYVSGTLTAVWVQAGCLNRRGYYDDHYNNFPGQPFPMEYWGRMHFMKDMLRKSSWHGEIDLTNQQELTNFRNYVSA